MSIDEVCDAIDWPPEQLAGNCHAVSCSIVRSGIAGPRARVARGGYAGYLGQHSWVVVPDDDLGDLIIDATVNGVAGGSPRLFLGRAPDLWAEQACAFCDALEDEHPVPDCDYFEQPEWPYDEGMQVLREARTPHTPYPGISVGDQTFELPDDLQLAAHILGASPPYNSGRLMWLANRSVREMGGPGNMRSLIHLLDENGMGAFVPIDIRPMVGLD